MPTYPTEVRVARIGVALALYPSDPSLAMQVRRAPDSSGSPDTGSAEIIGLAPAGARTFVDLVGAGAVLWYSSRHVAPSGEVGDWTRWVSASPKRLPDVLPNVPDIAALDRWTTDIEFAPKTGATANGAEWTAGDLVYGSGQTYAIDAGSSPTYGDDVQFWVYFDPSVSTTELQTSSDFLDAVGPEVILLAVALTTADGTGSLSIDPTHGLSSLNAARVFASTLAAISANLGTVTAGTINTAVLIASELFTASGPVFEGSVVVEGNQGDTRVILDGDGTNGGEVEIYSSAGALLGILQGSAPASGSRLILTSTNGLTLVSGSDQYVHTYGGRQWGGYHKDLATRTDAVTIGTDDLETITFPAGTVAAGTTIRLHCWGNTTGNTSPRYVNVLWGGVELFSRNIGNSFTDTDWDIVVEIHISPGDDAAFVISARTLTESVGTTPGNVWSLSTPLVDFLGFGVDDNDFDLVIQAEMGNGGDVINLHGSVVELLP